jgi:hypothetical protein
VTVCKWNCRVPEAAPNPPTWKRYVVPEVAAKIALEVEPLLRQATGDRVPSVGPVQTVTTVSKEEPVVLAAIVISEPGVNWYQTVLLLSNAQVGLGSLPSSVAEVVSTEVEDGTAAIVSREAKLSFVAAAAGAANPRTAASKEVVTRMQTTR